MFRWIVGSSLKSRRIVIAVAAVTMVLGFLGFRGMPRDLLPEFAPPTVEVQTEALGLSAAEVEELITVPLEQDLLNGVAFLDTIRSESMAGLSSIQMIFEPGTNLLDARQVVEERLTQAHALPQVSKPPQMLQPRSSTSRVMMVGLSSDQLSLIDMSILTRWTIRPRLMGVPGVANVAVWGNQDRQLQVLVDPTRLHAHGVSLQQIIETTANAQFVSNLSFVEASTPGVGGIIETPTQRFGVQHAVPFATPDDLAQVIVEGTEGAPLRLGDVTDVVVDHQLLIGDAVFTHGPGLLLVIEKLPGADVQEVTSGVEAALDDLRAGLSGVTIDTSLFRSASYLETSGGNLASALILGGLLLLVALGTFLFDWRTALIGAVAVACSLLAAGLVLFVLDTPLNSMVAAGLVLALVVVVDEAIGDVQNLALRLRQRRHRGEASAARLIVDASVEMRSAALYAVMITLIPLVPTLFTGGAFGAFFPSVALSYTVSVAASMLVALAVVPALGMTLLSGTPSDRREPPIVRWILPRYRRGLSRVLASPGPGLLLVGLILIAGLVSVPFLQRSLTPSFKDTNLAVHLSGPPGTSLTEMDRITARVGNEIAAIPGVLKVGGHAGRAVLSDQVVNANESELWVSIDPDADYDATTASIQDVGRGYPGLGHRALTYPSERIEEVLSGPREPLTVRIFGNDLEILRSKADQVRQMLSEIEGVDRPRVDHWSEEPTLDIEVDLAAAERYGIVPGDVRRAAATLLSGLQVGSLFDEQKVFEVVVWGTPQVRHDLSSIQDLPIDTPNGGQVRLADVARVRVAPFPTVVRHVDVSRSIDVTAGVSGRGLGDVTNDVRQRLEGVRFPIEYHAELVGDVTDRRAADREALGFAVAASIAILLLLHSVIRNWRLASLVFLTLPLSLAGGVVAALIDGRVASFGSIAGFLAVLGIAARHAVAQIRHWQDLRRREGEPFGRRLVLRGAGERLTPVLCSVLTTALAFVPLVIAGGVAGLEIVHPMAVVVLGGLVSSTILTLFVVPTLYVRYGSGSEPDLSVVLAGPTIDLTPPAEAELTSR